MAIEQTPQLIQLILNVVLMVGASGIMLCAAVMHQVMLENRARAGRGHRSVRHRLHRQQRQTRRSVFWLSGACWLLGVSCGALVLRSIGGFHVLVPFSLGLFAIACGLFLIGTGALLLSVIVPTETPTPPKKKTDLSQIVEFRGRSMRRRWTDPVNSREIPAKPHASLR